MNPFKTINKRLEEIEDVLTRDNSDPKDYIGSEIDSKVEQKDFDSLEKSLNKVKATIGERKIDNSSMFALISWGYHVEKSKTIFDEIGEIKDSIKKIEEYLGIERKSKESKVDKYFKKTTKKNAK